MNDRGILGKEGLKWHRGGTSAKVVAQEDLDGVLKRSGCFYANVMEPWKRFFGESKWNHRSSSYCRWNKYDTRVLFQCLITRSIMVFVCCCGIIGVYAISFFISFKSNTQLKNVNCLRDAKNCLPTLWLSVKRIIVIEQDEVSISLENNTMF